MRSLSRCGIDVLERVPRCVVGPLHVVQQEEQRPLLRREPEEIGELLEQAHLAPAARELLAAPLERRIQQASSRHMRVLFTGRRRTARSTSLHSA